MTLGFPRFAKGILWISFPWLGENILIASSLHPLRISLPVLGKHIERQLILGSYILRMGDSEASFQTTISPPEHVPKTPEKLLIMVMSLIFLEWHV